MGRKILVADDDPLNLDLMADVLRSLRGHGVDVLTADDGLQAFNLVHEMQPELVLLDAEMPGMSGCEVCRQLRANPRTADITIFMVTANLRETQRREAYDAGVNDYILKPFDVHELRSRVMAVLGIEAR